MEISTSPHRPVTTPWGRLLALVVVLAPVCLLVLLPQGLGLERYVISGSSMHGARADGIPRGAVAFERLVAVDELRPGDVITFRPPPTYGDAMVTRRVVSLGPTGIVTRADAAPAPDPWLLQPAEPVVPRVALTVPWLGYLYLGLGRPAAWLLLAGAVGLLTLFLTRASRARR